MQIILPIIPDAFKFGGYWQINDQVSVRGTYQTATRHGGISDCTSTRFKSNRLRSCPCGTDPETGIGPSYTANSVLEQA